MKFLKIISLCHFWPKSGKNLALNILQMWHLELYLPWVSIHAFEQALLFTLKGIPHVKYEKNLLIMPFSFTFFTTLGLIWPKFCPKTTPALIFFCWFLMKYANGIQLMLITLIGIQKFWKKLLKSPKITIFWPKSKYRVLAELWMFFYFVWCFLLTSVIYRHNNCADSRTFQLQRG